MRNTGDVRRGDLLLLDAGVECHNLYTADVTRTMPINGTYSPAQRRIYELVLAAQQAGIDAVKPGATFKAPHEAAMKVLAQGLFDLGILKEEPEVALRPEQSAAPPLHPARHQSHARTRRARLRQRARRDVPRRRARRGLRPHGRAGSVLPERTTSRCPRSIAASACASRTTSSSPRPVRRNLSAALPRDPDEVEAWMASLWTEDEPEPRVCSSA